MAFVVGCTVPFTTSGSGGNQTIVCAGDLVTFDSASFSGLPPLPIADALVLGSAIIATWVIGWGIGWLVRAIANR